MGMKILLMIAVSAAGASVGGTMTLLRGETLEIPVAQYGTVRFEVGPDMAREASAEGSLTVLPDTSSVEMILLHADDYLRWRGNGDMVDTLSYLKTSSGAFQLDLPGLGRYALVISNRGNYRPVSVTVDMDLLYKDSGSGDPLPSAMKLALLVIALGVASVVIGSAAVRYGKNR